MNRRAFFQAAALSTATVFQTKGRTISHEAEPAHIPQPSEDRNLLLFGVDLAGPNWEQYLADERMDLFVWLRELYPADPGQLSGAKLRIMEHGSYTALSAGIGDTLQPYGDRTEHWLGSVQGTTVARFAKFGPERDDHGRYNVFLAADENLPDTMLSLTLLEAGNRQLELNLGGHCFGILNGELLSRFLACLRTRLAQDRPKAS